MERILRRFACLGLAVALVLLVGTTGHVLLGDYTVFDAFYMTLITITTVGYSEIRPLTHAGRVFNSFVIFFGVTLMFLAIGAMAQSIIELELGEFFGKRRTRRMIDKLENHFIVCGFGRVGQGAAEELLRAGVSFVVIDTDERRVEHAIRAGMLAVHADATRDSILREVGVERARGLVAALATDADNLYLVLSAKTLNPVLHVSARSAEDQAEKKLRRVGADVVFTPYGITGARLAQALLRPHVAEFLDFTTQNVGLNVSIEQVRVGEGCELASRTLEQSRIRRELGVIVLAIRKQDGQMMFNPPADAVIRGGDYLIVMGERPRLHSLEKMLAEAPGEKAGRR